MRPSLSNTFIFWLFILLFFKFFFFGKNVLECASLLLEPCFAGKGGQEITSPSPSQKPSSNHRWIFVRTCISEATVRLTKGNQKEPRSWGSPRASALPSALLCLLYSPFGFVSNCILTFLAGVFLTRPDCLPTSTVKTCWCESKGSTARRGDREGR